jgi:dTDP-4-dehydrorhamnose reductase
MILLLGGTGYIGQAFQRELEHRGLPHKSLSRADVDYRRFDVLLPLLQETRATLVINAAGYTGRPNVDACETARADTLLGNVTLPLTVANACHVTGAAFAQISSGCIYSGAYVRYGNSWKLEPDLLNTELGQGLMEQPSHIRGFDENEPPNFSFRSPPCSFYSGSKALAEEVLAGQERTYLWRLRMPFDQQDNPRNYLSKLQTYPRLYQNINSLSHRGDFAAACLNLWQIGADFGTYNVVNPGQVSTRQVVELIQKHLSPERDFNFWESDAEFYQNAAVAPRSNCVLDAGKLLAAGVKMRAVEDALESALRHWGAADRR